MIKVKLFVMAVALAICSTATAQFSNTGTRGNQRTVRTSTGGGGFDGNGPQAGYKGFIEGGYTIGVGDYDLGRLELITTHGYQFNQYIFAGVGAGFKYYTDDELWAYPIFGDIRANILNNSISPFVDFKIGYAAGDADGFFLTPSVGCRFGFKNNCAMTVSVGYEMQKGTIYSYYYYGGYYYDDESTETIGGLALKVGFEF